METEVWGEETSPRDSHDVLSMLFLTVCLVVTNRQYTSTKEANVVQMKKREFAWSVIGTLPPDRPTVGKVQWLLLWFRVSPKTGVHSDLSLWGWGS